MGKAVDDDCRLRRNVSSFALTSTVEQYSNQAPLVLDTVQLNPLDPPGQQIYSMTSYFSSVHCDPTLHLFEYP